MVLRTPRFFADDVHLDVCSRHYRRFADKRLAEPPGADPEAPGGSPPEADPYGNPWPCCAGPGVGAVPAGSWYFLHGAESRAV